jgi:hypothetical protein
MTAAQQLALMAAGFWLGIAQEEADLNLKEIHTQRAIKNLMIASHGH